MLAAALASGAGASQGIAQVPAAQKLWPNLRDNIARPLRYQPDGEDFVIVNGAEFFNRPLYGGNSGFRVDAGDRPEFVLYLPGRGGNLRLGVKVGDATKWLHDAEWTEARYRPGEMHYRIRDPLLGPDAEVRVGAVALAAADSLVLKVELTGAREDVELVAAYGGVNGQRGRRDGDIGTESVPISEWFQLKPEACRGNEITLADESFSLRNKGLVLQGWFSAGSRLAVADARGWHDKADALVTAAENTATPELPVLVAKMKLSPRQSVLMGVQRTDTVGSGQELETYREVNAAADTTATAPVRRLSATELPQAYADALAHFSSVRRQVQIETPDPFLNAAMGALNVAADAVWDEGQGAVMHGAIAWRTRLLGWRGPYAMDALGWHSRARRHLTYWAGRQNTTPVPERIPPADANANLARSEAALHSNGDMSNSHYDMNLVYVDALFRHLLWTGDQAFARAVWPVIERHLAWERRLFRREFAANGETLPLYEAYAAIWASDDLQYSGGGSTHGSAYNYWHNLLAARVARWIGEEPHSYEEEARQIARGMRALLWTGTHFAEYKDWLGLQQVHPSAGLWSFYHTMDSGMPDSREAAAMTEEILRRPAIPIVGPGVPGDQPYAMLPSTDWMPYTWSLNNVVLGENVHTALGLWQAGRSNAAFRLMKSSLLASMFMGICPGNVGSMNYLDVYRRESQRDFADGSGVLSRAVIEGLFGVRPDAIAGELTLAPGFPETWTEARLTHPQVGYEFRREGDRQVFRLTGLRGAWPRVRLLLADHRTPHVAVNGRSVDARRSETGASSAWEVSWNAREGDEVTVSWRGEPAPPAISVVSPERHVETSVTSARGSLEPVDLATHFNDRVTEIFGKGKYLAPRSPFASLALPAQGIGYWAGHVNASAEIDDSGLRERAGAQGGFLTLPDGVRFATPGPGETRNVLFVSRWDNYPDDARVSLSGKSRRIHLLMAGSTNAMQSRIDNGEVVVAYDDGSTARLALRNPETWWPIEQDYFIDDFQFRLDSARLPTRVDLKTGTVRVLSATTFAGQGRVIPGGAATVLSLDLDPAKELRAVTVRALANDVVIGLMALTLER